MECDDGQTIPRSWICDSAADCEDESDEVGCDWECDDGERSIPEAWVCDDTEDCDDGSDEEDCSA